MYPPYSYVIVSPAANRKFRILSLFSFFVHPEPTSFSFICVCVCVYASVILWARDKQSGRQTDRNVSFSALPSILVCFPSISCFLCLCTLTSLTSPQRMKNKLSPEQKIDYTDINLITSPRYCIFFFSAPFACSLLHWNLSSPTLAMDNQWQRKAWNWGQRYSRRRWGFPRAETW